MLWKRIFAKNLNLSTNAYFLRKVDEKGFIHQIRSIVRENGGNDRRRLIMGFFFLPLLIVAILLTIFGVIKLLRGDAQSRRSRIVGNCLLISGSFVLGLIFSEFLYFIVWS